MGPSSLEHVKEAGESLLCDEPGRGLWVDRRERVEEVKVEGDCRDKDGRPVVKEEDGRNLVRGSEGNEKIGGSV